MIRLYCDVDSMSTAVVNGLRSAGFDVLTAFEAGNLLLPDEDQLAFATAQGRAIYTANVKDFRRLHGQWVLEGRQHAGILLRPRQQLPPGRQIAVLLELLRRYEEGSLAGQVQWIT